MIEPSSFSAAGSEFALTYLANVACKATVLLLAAACFDLLLGRRRPLARSGLWHATLAALAILPLAVMVLPSLFVLPGMPVAQSGYGRAGAAAIQPPPAALSGQHSHPQAGTGAVPRTLAQAPTDHHDDSGGPALARSLVPPYGQANTVLRQGIVGCVLGAYFVGFVVMTVRLAHSLKEVAGLLARAEPVAGEAWSSSLAHWRGELGVSRSVQLFVSAEVAVPVQIGWLRPAILLPPRVAASSDEGTSKAVLVHELGHVHRGDYAWNLLLRMLSIIYWPHPLLWLAGRRVAQLREQACDELCIHWLGGNAAYRVKLIELAAGLLLRRPIAALGIAMSQQSKLARRLAGIEASTGRRHCLASPLTRRSSIAVMLLIASLLGATTAARSVAQAQAAGDAVPQDRKPSESPSETKEAPPTPANKSDNKAPTTPSIVERSVGPFSNTAPTTGLLIISLTDAGQGKAAVSLIDGKATKPLLGTPEEQEAQIKRAVEKGLDAGKAKVLIQAEKGVPHRDVSRVAAAASAVDGVKVKIAVNGLVQTQSDQAESGPVRVHVERVKRGDFTVETSQPCELTAGQTSVVFARVPGVVTRMAVDIGDRVKRGQLLAELECLQLGPETAEAEALVSAAEAEQEQSRAAVQESEANLAAAQADQQKVEADVEVAAVTLKYRERQYERTKELVEDRSVDRRLLDEQEEHLSTAKAAHKVAKLSVEPAKALVRQREAAVASARAAEKLADARLRVTKLKLAAAKSRSEAVKVVSPMDGIVVERNANVGDFVAATDKQFRVCTVADLRRMSAVVQIPEIDALQIKRGAAARIFLHAFPGKTFAAKVSRVALSIDRNTGTGRVELELDADNSDGRLLPGLFGAAAVALEIHHNALSIPRSALWAPFRVITVVDGRAIRKPVDVGPASYDRQEIISGLEEGDLVITGLADPKQKTPDWEKQPYLEYVESKASD
jgi:HlyD family secretion protein